MFCTFRDQNAVYIFPNTYPTNSGVFLWVSSLWIFTLSNLYKENNILFSPVLPAFFQRWWSSLSSRWYLQYRIFNCTHCSQLLISMAVCFNSSSSFCSRSVFWMVQFNIVFADLPFFPNSTLYSTSSFTHLLLLISPYLIDFQISQLENFTNRLCYLWLFFSDHKKRKNCDAVEIIASKVHYTHKDSGNS